MSKSSTSIVCVSVKYTRPKYKTLRDWMADPQNVYIGRKGTVFITRRLAYPPKDSIWMNPFRVGVDGCQTTVLTKYRNYITEKIESGKIPKTELEKLKGKTLGCWCSPKSTGCHGRILIELINKYCGNERSEKLKSESEKKIDCKAV